MGIDRGLNGGVIWQIYIYLITEGNYSDYHIEFVTLDKNKAESIVNNYKNVGYDIEIRRLDEFAAKLYTGIRFDGDFNYKGEFVSYGENEKIEIYTDSSNINYYIVIHGHLLSSSLEKRIKIASDLLFQAISEGKLTPLDTTP